MKCHILFSGKNKKNISDIEIFNMMSTENFTHSAKH